jgi:hypothetical protein
MNVIVHSVTQINRDRQSIRFLMENGGAYRLGEIIVPVSDDPTVAANTAAESVWANATAVDAAWWFAARERSYRNLYIQCQLAMYSVMQTGGSLATANAAALQVLGSDQVKLAEWSAYLTMYKNGGTLTERELFDAITTFITLGRLAGVG